MKNTPVKLNNPAAALLISSLRRAARVPLCGMCAEVRQEVAEGIWCPRCGDLEPRRTEAQVEVKPACGVCGDDDPTLPLSRWGTCEPCLRK